MTIKLNPWKVFDKAWNNSGERGPEFLNDELIDYN